MPFFLCSLQTSNTQLVSFFDLFDFGVLRKKKFQTGAMQSKKPRIKSRNFSLMATTTGNSDKCFLKLLYSALNLILTLRKARKRTKFAIINRNPFERFFFVRRFFRLSLILFSTKKKLMKKSRQLELLLVL